jgi:hypothetical protein
VFKGERTSTDALADLQQRFGQIFT